MRTLEQLLMDIRAIEQILEQMDGPNKAYLLQFCDDLNTLCLSLRKNPSIHNAERIMELSKVLQEQFNAKFSN